MKINNMETETIITEGQTIYKKTWDTPYSRKY